ncbi:MAG: nitrilase-related carbon-nitrogen hydrolase, partial [Candidatus Omnitrophota bacterium]
MFKIAVAQINTTVGDLTGNTERILEYISLAKKAKSQMVIFPELTICGYPP